MTDFDELRRQLRQARAQRDSAGDGAFSAAERIKRIEERLAALKRSFEPNNPSHLKEREQLEAARAMAEGARKEWQAAGSQAARFERELFDRYAQFSDPRKAIGQLSDLTPILLMPVRLETRFKTVIDRETGARRAQLWVRVYPDDCLVDSFEPTLSETEVANARLYWSGIWQAGGVEDQERGAWRGLVASHGAGRAEWIVDNYQPINFNQRPAKALPTDVILVIPTETPLADPERAATAAFWRAVWLADGDAAKAEAARAVLAAAVGADRAAEIVSSYIPDNLGVKPAAPLTRQQVNVSTAFVVFPKTEDLDLKRRSWSRAPRVMLLPDRFVFVGYSGSAPPEVVVGGPVPSPLIVGPDPSAPEEQQLQQDDQGELVIPDEMRWMVDFDRAVQVGMGFRVDLSETQATRGFDRVLVVGLRTSADQAEAKSELEALIAHHRFGHSGFSLVPQGTPTNNTESGSAAPAPNADADASFDALKQDALFSQEFDWLDKQDGQWLAEYLGIDGDVLKKIRNSGGRDQADARAMNVALWPATLGYWMETMMSPVFTSGAVEQTREFFNRFVVGRGTIPAIRIGSQPYGILPATALSRMQWLERRGDGDITGRLLGTSPLYLGRLYAILKLIDADWQKMAADVSYVGKPGDPHQTLLDIVGLHSGSVEFSQRYAESIEQLFNRLNLEGLGALLSILIVAGLQQAGVDLLEKLGYGGDEQPDLLSKFFFGKHYQLKGPLIDDRPLSESEPIRAYTADGKKNYVEWLIDAANTSLDALYQQQGFLDNKRPQALLYLMLRHALQLGYHDVSVRLHESAGLLNAETIRLARHDDPFIHVRAQPQLGESRYQLLYKPEQAITGSPTTLVGDYIGTSLATLLLARYLREQVQALDRLKGASTARLERAFTEHIDSCAYRLDAWMLGLVNYQLAAMRNLRDRDDAQPRQGIYLGAYAWQEDVRPENKILTPVRLTDPDLIKTFTGDDQPQLTRDSANQGFIHAPSLNQAVAAAVLRNGYLSSASPANRQTMAVNLTSERVRIALGMIEGIRGGQSLGALLGYQFERGLHDRHGLAEVDKFIYKLRKAFPLRSDRLSSTQTQEDVSIEAIEARNVVDGLALVNHIKSTGSNTYPFGKSLPAATPAEAAAIDAEAERLLDTHDAVADLALAEGVYQAVLGNYDAVAATYDAYSKGNFPPEPQVVRTPASGIGLTHRVGLHLEAGVSHTTSPVAGVGMTPRAQAEPSVNLWLAGVLPPLGQVAVVVSFLDAATNTTVEREVTLQALDIQPADLLQIVREDDAQAMSELDDRIVQFTVAHHAPRPDVPVTIRYMQADTAPYAVFELMPLVRHLRRLTQTSRVLRPSDLALGNEAAGAEDEALFVDKQRMVAVRDALQSLRTDLGDFLADLEAPLADLANRRGELVAGADGYVQTIVELLVRAAGFAIPQSGWGFAYDFKQRVFRAVLAKSADLAARWTGRLAEYDDLIAAYNALPPATPDGDKLDLLTRAEQLISTQVTSPLPPAPDDLRDTLQAVKRPAFAAKLAQFDAVKDTTRTSVTQLLSDVDALLPITDFDFVELTFVEQEDELVRFAEDVVSVLRVIIAEADRRLARSQELFDQHDGAAQPSARVKALEDAAKALLGDDFVIVPEFNLGATRGTELENALSASAGGSLFDYLVNTVKVDFPVDTWLYGLARVREKMRSWEQVVMLAGALGAAEPELTALQLPFLPDDHWLALEFPPEATLTTDRLLYTAHFAAPFQKAARQCGLLLDEWTEVIPSSDATTGVTFHYDRPNSEPPQTWLLVTPSDFRGAWQWDDLVDALNETLDFAKRRAVEPVHVDRTTYARFLPATIMAVTMRQLTISANLALNNKIQLST